MMHIHIPCVHFIPACQAIWTWVRVPGMDEIVLTKAIQVRPSKNNGMLTAKGVIWHILILNYPTNHLNPSQIFELSQLGI